MFIQQTFNTECIVSNADSIYITYVNQLTGPRLSAWPKHPSTFTRDGHKFYKASKQPDSWCDEDPFPESPLYPYMTMPNCVSPPETYLQKRTSDIDKFIGINKIRQHHGKITSVIYSKKSIITFSVQKIGRFFKSVFLQELILINSLHPFLRSSGRSSK